MTNKWLPLWTSLSEHAKASFAAGMAYEEKKPAPHVISQSGSIAHFDRPYANPWFHVLPPPGANPKMWAVACKCSLPTGVIGQTLRPHIFRSQHGEESVMLAQCSYCNRIYWS